MSKLSDQMDVVLLIYRCSISVRRHGVFPVEVNAVKPICVEEVDDRFDKDGTARGRPGHIGEGRTAGSPATYRDGHLQVRVLRLETDRAGVESCIERVHGGNSEIVSNQRKGIVDMRQ